MKAIRVTAAIFGLCAAVALVVFGVTQNALALIIFGGIIALVCVGSLAGDSNAPRH